MGVFERMLTICRVWGVENSADNFERVIDGVAHDITEENPSDEVNFRTYTLSQSFI